MPSRRFHPHDDSGAGAPVVFDPAPLEPLTQQGRFSGDKILYYSAVGGTATILLMLAALLIVLILAAVPSVKRYKTGFLTTSEWRTEPLPVLLLDGHGQPIEDPDTGMKMVDPNKVNPPNFGAVAPVYGTAVTSGIALLLAVPFSFGSAIFLVRIAPKFLVGPVSFLIEFLAAIPSIAYGLWGMFVLEVWMGGDARWGHPLSFLAHIPVLESLAPLRIPTGGIEAHLAHIFGNFPGLQWIFNQKINGQWVPVPLTGRDIFVAGIILGIMIIPIITSISRDVLRSVPRAQIEGTIALGATWWQSCREMLKYSRSALFGAVILGLARAAGETMAVLMVMGSAASVPTSPFQPGTTMAAMLAGQFPEASKASPLLRGALMELALLLLVMSLIFNVIARTLVVGKSSRSAAAH